MNESTLLLDTDAAPRGRFSADGPKLASALAVVGLLCFLLGVGVNRHFMAAGHATPAMTSAGMRPVVSDPRALFLIKNAMPSGTVRCGTPPAPPPHEHARPCLSAMILSGYFLDP